VILTHRSGRFPCGYLFVRTVEDAVIGMFPDGSEAVTGWTLDDAHNFQVSGQWRPVDLSGSAAS
jgi:hypothetical protein